MLEELASIKLLVELSQLWCHLQLAAAPGATRSSRGAKPKPPPVLSDSITDKEATRLWIAQMWNNIDIIGFRKGSERVRNRVRKILASSYGFERCWQLPSR
jgi:hypothetical protein